MGGLVPPNEVWRTGADEATTLRTDVDLDINGLKVPKGVYAPFTITKENSWTLIVNKTAKQWGAFSYKEATDLGRTNMTVSKADFTCRAVHDFAHPGGEWRRDAENGLGKYGCEHTHQGGALI